MPESLGNIRLSGICLFPAVFFFQNFRVWRREQPILKCTNFAKIKAVFESTHCIQLSWRDPDVARRSFVGDLCIGALVNMVLFSAVSILLTDEWQSKRDCEKYKAETRMLLPIEKSFKKEKNPCFI